MLPNAWAHAKAQAHHKQGMWFQYWTKAIWRSTNLPYMIEKVLPNLPYSKDYLELLDNINNEDIMFNSIKNPPTLTDEHYARVMLEGVDVKRKNRALKENVISPELSVHCIALHAQDQLTQIVSFEGEILWVRG